MLSFFLCSLYVKSKSSVIVSWSKEMFSRKMSERNALAAATLLAAFVGTGSTFLAFAVLAERRGLSSVAYPNKGLYYLGGLTEATETLLAFAAMCLWPRAFPIIAAGFAGLCALTVLTRLWAGWQLLASRDSSPR